MMTQTGGLPRGSPAPALSSSEAPPVLLPLPWGLRAVPCSEHGAAQCSGWDLWLIRVASGDTETSLQASAAKDQFGGRCYQCEAVAERTQKSSHSSPRSRPAGPGAGSDKAVRQCLFPGIAVANITGEKHLGSPVQSTAIRMTRHSLLPRCWGHAGRSSQNNTHAWRARPIGAGARERQEGQDPASSSLMLLGAADGLRPGKRQVEEPSAQCRLRGQVRDTAGSELLCAPSLCKRSWRAREASTHRLQLLLDLASSRPHRQLSGLFVFCAVEPQAEGRVLATVFDFPMPCETATLSTCRNCTVLAALRQRSTVSQRSSPRPLTHPSTHMRVLTPLCRHSWRSAHLATASLEPSTSSESFECRADACPPRPIHLHADPPSAPIAPARASAALTHRPSKACSVDDLDVRAQLAPCTQRPPSS
eukprot:860640-Rhodomonas_salina.1